MRKRGYDGGFVGVAVFILVSLLVCALSIAGIATKDGVEVDQKVIEELEEFGEVSVIVVLKDKPMEGPTVYEKKEVLEERKEMVQEVQEEVLEKLDIVEIGETGAEENAPKGLFGLLEDEPDLELKHQYSIINGFSGNITEEGLKKLQEDPNVEDIFVNDVKHILIETSVPLINSNDVWNISVDGISMNGSGETVCVLDTGIYYNHSSLGGKLGNRVIAGHDYYNDDNDPIDDHGHGTHVAGIIGSNHSTYRGVAPGAKFVAMKVCNAAGSSCPDADILAALEGCIGNRTAYNISVISISLGGGQYTSYCGANINSQYSSLINEAIDNNISVVIATGNTNLVYTNATAGVAAPACVENATRVTSTDKSNSMASYGFRHSNFPGILAAPGGRLTGSGNCPDNDRICSTWKNGGFLSISGTSMAAPHVSGVVTLIRQYWRVAYDQTPTPKQIENKLRMTGLWVADTAGSNLAFPRVDVLRAIQPFINFTSSSAVNNTVIGANFSFINISSDVNLSTAILQWTYSNGSVINFTMSKKNGTSYNFNVTHLVEGKDTYRVFGNDTASTYGASSTRTLNVDLTSPAVTIVVPNNGTNVSRGFQAFNATINEPYPDVVLFRFDNASGNGFNVSAINNSGNWNTNLDLGRLGNGLHTMTVSANDTIGNVNDTEFIRFIVDRVPPAVTITTPLNRRNFTIASGNQTFVAMVADTAVEIDTVLFSFDNATGNAFNVTAVNNSGEWNVSYNVSTLFEGMHTLTVFANDSLGNVNDAETITFVVDNTPPRVVFVSPDEGEIYIFTSSNQTFNVTVRDMNLTIDTVLFSFDNATGEGFNLTATNQSGHWVASCNVSILADGTNSVTVFANDTVGNLNNTEVLSFTVAANNPVVTLDSPVDHFNSSSATITFDCSATDNLALADLTIYGDWGSGWHANETAVINGTDNETTFSITLVDGTYLWNCLASDTEANTAFAAANRSITIDVVTPVISAVSSGTPTSSSATVTWTTSESANSSLGYGTTQSLGTSSASTSWTTSHSRGLSSLSASTTYYYNVTSSDHAGNCFHLLLPPRAAFVAGGAGGPVVAVVAGEP